MVVVAGRHLRAVRGNWDRAGDMAVDRTVDDVLRDYAAIFAGRTHYVGQEPRDDELLVAEIERLRAELADANTRCIRLETELCR